MKILVTICARARSKRLAGKNTKLLAGKPLIAYTIEAAKRWGRANSVVVSTDSSEIADIAFKYGVQVIFPRPRSLCTDKSPKLPVIKHAVEYLRKNYGEIFDLIVDLAPTSPLRTAQDIEKAFRIMINEKPKTLFSVAISNKNPYFNLVEVKKNNFAIISKEPKQPVFRMQDAPIVYEINGAIYMFWGKNLNKMNSIITQKSRVYIMPAERSVDIDTAIDFKIADLLLKSKIRKC